MKSIEEYQLKEKIRQAVFNNDSASFTKKVEILIEKGFPLEINDIQLGKRL